jgi:predicted RNA binding protein YcfA (HicA-like mRNA interferase family)
MTYSELEKKLKRAGCSMVRNGRGHEIWFSPLTNQTFLVGRHKTEDVKPGTYNRIMRDAGLK